jgi:hypothetical protein
MPGMNGALAVAYVIPFPLWLALVGLSIVLIAWAIIKGAKKRGP